jgi:hypothetical protein
MSYEGVTADLDSKSIDSDFESMTCSRSVTVSNHSKFELELAVADQPSRAPGPTLMTSPKKMVKSFTIEQPSPTNDRIGRNISN